MSLREEVARRLILAHGAFFNSREAELLPDQAAQAMAWGVVANEAIRIAEWARRECVDHDDDGSASVPLTLPPVDWSPE